MTRTPRSLTRAAALLAAVLPLAASSAAPPVAPATPADPWRQELEEWRRERTASLRDEDGWLTLVGLFWLKEGENRFGTAADNEVVLPRPAAGTVPERAGSFRVEGGKVTLAAAPSAGITRGGAPVTSLALVPDTAGEPTTLELGSLRFHVVERGGRLGVRVRDRKSPALAAFHGVDSFPSDPSWRVEARFERYDPPKPVPVPNVLGQVEEQPSPGAVVFERDGKTHSLDALPGGEDGSLFLIFADATNGDETYGAGRFLAAGPPRDGRVVVDFNRAYNPPCAFTAFATCPLPPRQNRLALRVEAGEKAFGSHHH